MGLITGAAVEHVDVLIIGAGISGIGCAYYLQKHHPQRSYRILEARERTGGTWDLFRFPGIRSDSDLHTFGFEFKPWNSENAIADGAEILDYIREAARENDIDAAHPHEPSRHVTGMVLGRGALGRRRSSATARRHAAAERRLGLRRDRLLPLRRGLHARAPGAAELRGPGGASAEVAARIWITRASGSS